jgi:uncharacterized protein (DUF1778 family)
MARKSEVPKARPRLEVRVAPGHHALIHEAVEFEHVSMTSFGLDPAIEPRSIIAMANDDFDRFFAALDQPEAVVRELAELFRSPPFPGG